MSKDPFTVLSTTISAIDPALLSITSSSSSTPASTPVLSQDQIPRRPTTLSALPSPTTLSVDLTQDRAHSQPPEHFPRPIWSSSEPCHPPQPRHPYPPAEYRQLRDRNTSIRHHPYSRPPSQKIQRLPPTSAPRETSHASTFGSIPSKACKESYIFNLHHDQTTLALGIQIHLTQLMQACEGMRTFLQQGFSEGDMGGDDAERAEVEFQRLQARKTNRQITELDEELASLSRHSDPSYRTTSNRVRIPKTGFEIQKLGHSTIHPLLDAYTLPFTPNMFLFEKKALYLRFIGAGRALMFRVLDS